MKKIGGLPAIGLLLKRLQYCKMIDKIVLATSRKKENNILANYVKKIGFDVFRGPENDVLKRFALVVQKYKPKFIVRLTGDCVLIEPKIVDLLIKHFKKKKADYSWVDKSFAEGLDAEIFTKEAILEANKNAKLQYQREHVTQYIHRQKTNFICLPLRNVENDENYRIVLDEAEDLKVIRKIKNNFKNRINFSFKEIKAFLNKNPKIAQINKNIVRNEGLIKSMEKIY